MRTWQEIIEMTKLREILKDCQLARMLQESAGHKAYGLVPVRVDVYARIKKAENLFK